MSRVEQIGRAHTENQPSTIAAAFLELCVLAHKLARKDHTDPRVATLHDAATILEQEYPQHVAAQAIEAGTDETRNAAQPEGRERGPKGAPE